MFVQKDVGTGTSEQKIQSLVVFGVRCFGCNLCLVE